MISLFRAIKDAEKEKEAMLLRNEGLLLEKLITFHNGRGNSIRSFSFSLLKNATNNFHQDKVFFRGVDYILYEGFLQDRRVIVKKYRAESDYHEDFAISDIVFSLQLVMHENVLRLLGCCLESSIPLLVFEFAEKGSLDDYIYNSKNRPHFRPLSWKNRLKIAVDVANVIAYLHTGFPRPIIHTGIKTRNILLDEDYGARVTDFSSCIFMPEGETHITANPKGTVGYIAPEYATKGTLNEKIDVYSFGILLLVLLTRQYPHNPFPDTEDQYRPLVNALKKHMENDRFEEIFDPLIVGEEPWPGIEQQLKAFLMIALHCTSANPEDRPKITDVGEQLRQMYKSLI